jgi:hypothetical protein
MMLHCASRLGVLSYLYKHRHSVAQTIGLITEVPIALCNGDYDFNQELTLQQHDGEESFPVTSLQAREILLFLHETDLNVKPELSILRETTCCLSFEKKYFPPGLSIFHPPS